MIYSTLLCYTTWYTHYTLTGLVSDGRDDGGTILCVEPVAASEGKLPAAAGMVEDVRRGQGGNEALVV